MNRRGFIGIAAAAWAAMAVGVGAAEAPPRQIIELRTYSFADEAKLAVFAEFAGTSLIPALNRAGVKPVGLLRLRKADNEKLNLAGDPLEIVMVLAHADADAAFSVPAKLDADAEYAAAAKSVLGTPMKDPVYARYTSQWMRAFAGCPKVEVPCSGEDRLFQLRIYESHNEDRALRKIEMFNEGGEIGIFRRDGMNPVFFGQSFAGTLLPNLTYMLGFADKAAMDAAWDAFRKDPAWLKLKDDPKYADTVSRITNLILRPLPGSQL